MASFRNYFFGVLNSSITAICGIITIPILIRYFGLEGYGLISFYYLILAAVQIFDFGLSATLLRQTALSFKNDTTYIKSLLKTFLCIYLLFGLIFSSLLITFTSYLTQHWLKISVIKHTEVTISIILIAAILFIRWPVSLYQAVLLGSNNQILSSKLNIGMVILSQIGAIFFINFTSNTIVNFFLWIFIASIIHHVTLMYFTNRKLETNSISKINFKLISNTWKYSLQMSGISVIGLLLTQLDKLMLSKLLPLSSFAHYSLAVTITSSLFIIFIPFYNIIYPKFTSLISNDNRKELIVFYKTSSYILCSLLFPILFFLSLNANLIVFYWTQSHQITDAVVPILIPMLIGTTIQGIMYIPYAMQQALGKVKIPLIVCCFMLILMAITIPYLTSKYGATGGALSWLIVNVFYFFASTTATHKYLINIKLNDWLIFEIGKPLNITLIGFVFFWVITKHNYSKDIVDLCLSSLISIICLYISLKINKNSNFLLKSFINAKISK